MEDNELIGALLATAQEQPLRNALHKLVKTYERDEQGDKLRKRCGVCAKNGISKGYVSMCAVPGQREKNLPRQILRRFQKSFKM
ncbi:hypothetical protein J6590_015096 [Homalodisca vitripennis]|nr:hypothetical protein J6590_015096 [Homalodisca vitripennis]